jgi:hypothetical protein
MIGEFETWTMFELREKFKDVIKQGELKETKRGGGFSLEHMWLSRDCGVEYGGKATF